MYAELTDVTDPENYAEPEAIIDNSAACPKCTSKLKELDLGTRILYTCGKDTCGYRRTLAKKP
jgi:hypothetical protein